MLDDKRLAILYGFYLVQKYKDTCFPFEVFFEKPAAGLGEEFVFYIRYDLPSSFAGVVEDLVEEGFAMSVWRSTSCAGIIASIMLTQEGISVIESLPLRRLLTVAELENVLYSLCYYFMSLNAPTGFVSVLRKIATLTCGELNPFLVSESTIVREVAARLHDELQYGGVESGLR